MGSLLGNWGKVVEVLRNLKELCGKIGGLTFCY